MRQRSAAEKVVVFSSVKPVVLHLSTVLAKEGIVNVKIIKGDAQTDQQSAVHRFNTDASCTVLVLHAGTAAAGQ